VTVVVRRIAESDRAAIAEIYDSDAVVRQTAQVPYRGEAFWQEFYRSRDPNCTELVAEIDGKVVGHLGLLTTSVPRRRHVANFGIAVHEGFHRKGVGSALIAEMVRLCDDYLNIVRLELTVHPDNARAIALYEKFGFEGEGIARFGIFVDGRFSGLLHMARLNPNYASLLQS
jgi:putative acetyltransferase